MPFMPAEYEKMTQTMQATDLNQQQLQQNQMALQQAQDERAALAGLAQPQRPIRPGALFPFTR